MDIFLHSLYLIAGIACLYFGAEWLVQGSAQIALKFGISPLVVGLTIVAFATSSPELFLGITANLSGHPTLAVTNVVGSNICNIALILGVGALIRPIRIQAEIVLREMPILIFISAVFIWMLWDLELVLWEGIVLTAGIIGYVCFNLYYAKEEDSEAVLEEFDLGIPGGAETEAEKNRTLGKLIGLIILGLAVLVGGSWLLVEGGVGLARVFGISETTIGLTMFALGTSLPELATSIVASLRKQGDIITGNAVGSCIFNILGIIGITILVRPMSFSGDAPADLWNQADLWIMLGMALIVFPLMWSRKLLSRWEGAILLAGYIAYVAYVALRPGGDF